MIWFLQVFLLPDYPAIKYPGLALSFLAEVGLALVAAHHGREGR